MHRSAFHDNGRCFVCCPDKMAAKNMRRSPDDCHMDRLCSSIVPLLLWPYTVCCWDKKNRRILKWSTQTIQRLHLLTLWLCSSALITASKTTKTTHRNEIIMHSQKRVVVRSLCACVCDVYFELGAGGMCCLIHLVKFLSHLIFETFGVLSQSANNYFYMQTVFLYMILLWQIMPESSTHHSTTATPQWNRSTARNMIISKNNWQ